MLYTSTVQRLFYVVFLIVIVVVVQNRVNNIYCVLAGPSLCYDSSWTSTAQCLEQVGALVAQGLVEAAIVSVGSLIGHISTDKEFDDIKFLSTDGHCSPFDAQGVVYTRYS